MPLVQDNLVKMRGPDGMEDQRLAAQENGFISVSVGNNLGLPVANVRDTDYGYDYTNPGAGLSGTGNNIDNEAAFQQAVQDNMALALYYGARQGPEDLSFTYVSEPYCLTQDGTCVLDSDGQPLPDSKLVGYNMPYPHLWDTGGDLDYERTTDGTPDPTRKRRGGNFVDTVGSWTRIVPPGTESESVRDVMRYTADPLPDPYYKTPAENAFPHSDAASGIGGSLELVEYYVLHGLMNGLNCIPQPDQLPRTGDGMTAVLGMAGIAYTRMGNFDLGQPPSLEDWPLVDRGSLGNYCLTGLDGSCMNDPISGKIYPYQFPNAFGPAAPGSILQGLDNAIPGDIAVLNLAGRLIIVYVLNVDTAHDNPTQKSVTVSFRDQGKIPTIIGTSIADSGQIRTQNIYNLSVPVNVQAQVLNHTLMSLIGTDPGCAQLDQQVVYSARAAAQTAWNACKVVVTPDGRIIDQSQTPDCINLLPIAQAACMPACYDSDYIDCVLPDPASPYNPAPDTLTINPDTGNSLAWDSVKLYRPMRDIRQCLNSGIDLTATYAQKLGMPIMPGVYDSNSFGNIPSNYLSYCRIGADPPLIWHRQNGAGLDINNGASAGAVQNALFWGPRWNASNSSDDINNNINSKDFDFPATSNAR